MDHSRPYRPRLSRETRLLLITALLAVAALWILARVRFPDRPAAPNPVQPLLTQLAARPRFDELAADVADLRPRLQPLLLALQVAPAGSGETGGAGPGEAGGEGPAKASGESPAKAGHYVRRTVAGLRIRDDVALALLDSAAATPVAGGSALVARDPATGLAFIRVPGTAAARIGLWSPEQDRPRYLMATDASTGELSLHPVFVGSLHPTSTPKWPGRLWQLPAYIGVAAGAFLFTHDAALAGLVVDHGDGLALVPGETLLAEADRVLARPGRFPGHVGIRIQALTPAISRATGAASGVVVTWADARGPTGVLQPGDVIESANGEPVPTPEHWNTLVARLSAGQTLTFAVRSPAGPREVSLVAAFPPPSPDAVPLGLVLQTAAGMGAQVVAVAPESAARRAGLAAGDVITQVGDIRAPSPAQVRRTFDRLSSGRAVLVAFTRGADPHVSALEK